MSSNRHYIKYTLIILVAGIIVACSSDECYDNKNALPYAGCYGISDGKETQVQLQSVEVYGVDAPGDSILHDGNSSLSQFYLPFRIDHDTTQYVFRYLMDSSGRLDLRDTVTFVYTREPRFVSAACGVSYVFDIKEINNTGILIDSVVCPGMRITNAEGENIRIYYPISDSEESESKHQMQGQIE